MSEPETVEAVARAFCAWMSTPDIEPSLNRFAWAERFRAALERADNVDDERKCTCSPDKECLCEGPVVSRTEELLKGPAVSAKEEAPQCNCSGVDECLKSEPMTHRRGKPGCVHEKPSPVSPERGPWHCAGPMHRHTDGNWKCQTCQIVQRADPPVSPIPEEIPDIIRLVLRRVGRACESLDPKSCEACAEEREAIESLWSRCLKAEQDEKWATEAYRRIGKELLGMREDIERLSTQLQQAEKDRDEMRNERDVFERWWKEAGVRGQNLARATEELQAQLTEAQRQRDYQSEQRAIAERRAENAERSLRSRPDLAKLMELEQRLTALEGHALYLAQVARRIVLP